MNRDSAGGNDASIVIVAAGKGLRFGGDLPKQFLELSGKVVLMRTIDEFRSALPDAHIILVLSEDGLDIWKNLCAVHQYVSPDIVIGGKTRSDSVSNALDTISDTNSKIVMIHDGARPLVTKKLILDMYNAIRTDGHDAAVPAIMPTDALCIKENDYYLSPVDRNMYRNVQTPQSFRTSVLKKAYRHRAENISVADDAAMVKLFSDSHIVQVEGDRTNIKITSPLDIEIAALYLSRR